MAAKPKPPTEPVYSVSVTQTTRNRWSWTITTSDEENHPLYSKIGERWAWSSDRVSGEAKTADDAMRRAANLVGEHVALDVQSELKRTFAASAPVATATVQGSLNG